MSLRDKMTRSSSSEASTRKPGPSRGLRGGAGTESEERPQAEEPAVAILQLLAQLDDKLREVNLNWHRGEDRQVLKEALMQLEQDEKGQRLLSLEPSCAG